MNNFQNWQQIAFRHDPWESIPFAGTSGIDADVLVGIVCAVVGIVGLFFGK